MRFQVTGELDYRVDFPSTLILNVHAQQSPGQTILHESFSVEPRVRVEKFLSSSDAENRLVRLQVGRKKELHIRYSAEVETEVQLIPEAEIGAVPVGGIQRDAIPYLFPSRYCQSDKLARLAWDLFGEITNPLERVTKIVDWIHDNVEYLPGSTNAQTSAFDSVTQRTGVCRDFAHLGIALCRALNIPARYVGAYACQLEPPDFHAVFEAQIDGRWLVFDPTRLASPNGLVRIATGRDAADAAVASIFGRVTCTRMEVSCVPAEGQTYTPLSRRQLAHKGVALGSRGVTQDER
ncbi:MAG: transglutaminase family protein [Planctomycetaceae bacterium]|nr:transglutaminase family protein [Planctomycetaceae bacterium]